MSAMTTQLAWGAITWPQGYERAGQTEWMVKCLQWATDYFVAAHTAEEELYGQVKLDWNYHNGVLRCLRTRTLCARSVTAIRTTTTGAAPRK